MKTRILVLNKAYWPHLGGVETIAKKLAEGMALHDLAVTVLCLGDQNDAFTLNGVTVIQIKKEVQAGSAPLARQFGHAMKTLMENTDLVHFHYPNPIGEWEWLNCLSRFKKNGTRVPRSLVTYHSDALRPRWLLPAYRWLTRRFLGSVDRVVTTSPQYAETSPLLQGGQARGRVKVIPLGVDVRRFNNPDPGIAERLTRETGKLGHPRILFVGRLVYYKGIPVLLKALELDPSLSCLMVGDGPLKPEVEKSMAGPLAGRLQRLEPLGEAEYPAIFYQADAFVLPSIARTEAFGLATAEAMAAGLPCVTTELGTGTSYVNENGITGYVVPPNDPEKLARALSLAARAEPLKRAAMVEAARARAWGLFDERDMLKAYLRLYEELLGRQAKEEE